VQVVRFAIDGPARLQLPRARLLLQHVQLARLQVALQGRWEDGRQGRATDQQAKQGCLLSSSGNNTTQLRPALQHYKAEAEAGAHEDRLLAGAHLCPTQVWHHCLPVALLYFCRPLSRRGSRGGGAAAARQRGASGAVESVVVARRRWGIQPVCSRRRQQAGTKKHCPGE
jgi:hypothetical protein